MPGKHNDHNFYLFLEKNEKNEKCLELLDLARKLIRKLSKNFTPPPQIVGLFWKSAYNCLIWSESWSENIQGKMEVKCEYARQSYLKLVYWETYRQFDQFIFYEKGTLQFYKGIRNTWICSKHNFWLAVEFKINYKFNCMPIRKSNTFFENLSDTDKVK